VWVTQLVVTDEVNPNRLATVKFNGRPRITAPDTVDAVAKWFEWSYAQRQIDKTTVDTSNTATEEWATAALDAGVEATVEPMTSLTGDKTAAKRVATAARVIPAALVEALNERADRPLRAMAGMRDIGLRSAFSESAYQIKLVNNLDALHEYGHALENRVPALNRMIWAFYQSRTEGDDVYASQRIPGVLTRQDWFFDSYSGRDYGAATQRNPERIGREVFTTGLESLFLGRGGSEQAALDDEHAAFMLGALLLASRPGADGVRIRPSGSTANVGFAKGEDVVFVPGDTTPDVSIDAALMQVMESPEWSDTIGSPFRRRAGRARGQWIETTISDHKMSLGDGERLVVTVEAETNRRNVRREPIIATGERGEGVEVRGGAPTGVASWAIFGADGQIVLSTDPRDELYLKPDETVDEFRERAKQAALEAAMRAKQNDLPSEAELGSMSLAELEALFFALRDNQTVNRNFLYLLRRHIKAKRQGVTIDALEVEAPTVASATAGATIEGLRGRDVLFEEVQTPKGDAWTQAVDTISKEISDEAMTEFADGMTALLIADDKRRQEYFDNAPPEARVFRSYGQLDLSFSDLTGDSGISPGEGVIAATFDPSFDLAGFSKTYSQLVQEEDVIPVTDDRDGYTLWMFWNEHEQVMKVFKVRDTLRRDDGTWELPTQFTDFGGPVGGVNGDDEFGAKRAAVAMMRGAWASSTDSVVVHLMREASLELSGRSQRQLRKSVEDKAEIHNRLSAFDEGVAAIEFMRPLAREVVQAGYANTQQRLKDLGVTEVTVYRGIATYNDLSQGRLVMGDVPLTSWTVDASVAQWFAESRLDQDEYYGGDPLVLVRTIPADQVVGWAKTSIGSEPESEVVLLGHDRADTLIVHTGDADVADFDTILPPRRASISAADEILLIDDNWLRTVRQSRGGATWAALFDGGVVARFSDDEWEVVGPEPERRTVAKMLGEHVENGWPFQFGGWSEDAFAAGIDPEWMKFRLLGSGARFVLGPAGALGSLPVSDPDLIVG
jgi:hypothetical protein